jgi:putative copper export protein
MSSRTAERRERAVAEFATIAVIVYAVAVLVLSVPAFFLGTGVQAIGATLDWWAPDPNADDGEAVIGTTVGLVSALVVIAAAAAVIVEVGRRYLMPPRVPIVVGTVALVVELVAAGVWVVVV